MQRTYVFTSFLVKVFSIITIMEHATAVDMNHQKIKMKEVSDVSP